MDHDVYGVAFVDEQGDRIRQLNLPAGALLDAAQRIEDRPIQHVPAGGGVQRRGRLGRRLLHHALDAQYIWVQRVGHRLDVEHAVRADVLGGNLEGAQHRSPTLGAHLRHGLQHTGRQHEVVGQQRDGILVGR